MQHYIRLGRNFPFPDYRPVYPRDPRFRISHYRLKLVFDLEARAVEGLADITVRADDGLVELDGYDLEIKNVQGPSPTYSYDGRRLLIRTLAGQEHEISVSYRARPRAGLYFILPDEKYPNRPSVIYSQGEPEYHRHWMPIYDYPNMKFTTELIVRVPGEFTVISNGDLVGKRDVGDAVEWHYRMDKPHSPYLISLVAGLLEGVEETAGDVKLLYYVPKGMKDLVRNSFSKTADMMKFFTVLTGVRYPFKTYIQVCVPEFIVGGMENTTAATLTDLTLHDDHAHLDFSSDPLIAHELAHQWFGDMVTCRDWSHIWLNESFATYLENLYLQKDKGDDEFFYELLNDLQSYLDEYHKRYSRPIVMRVYKYPEELFDRHAYPKGGLVLHSLKLMLGEEIFWRGIRQFLEKHAFNTADTEDLRKTLEAVSGRHLEWFFDQFIYSAGHPQLKLSYRWDERERLFKITVRQEQGEDSPETYDMPLEIIVNNDSETIPASIPLDRRETTVYLSLKAQPWHICVDPGLKLLREVKAEIPLEELINALQRCRYVVCRVEAARALGRMGGFRAVQALENAVLTDTFWGVSSAAAQALGEAGGSEARDALLRCLEKVRHPKVRRSIVDALRSFREDEKVGSSLSRVLSDPSESYYVRAAAASSLGSIRVTDYMRSLVENLKTPSHADVITIGCLQGLAELGTEEALKTIIDHTRLGNPNTVRIGATVALAKFPGRKEAYERLAELSRDPYDRVRQAVISAAREMLDHKLLPVLDEMAERDVNERVRRGAREVAKKIRDHLEKGVEYKVLKEELEKVRDENRRLVERISRLEGKGL